MIMYNIFRFCLLDNNSISDGRNDKTDGFTCCRSPDDGKKFRRSFEQKYGPKGRHLIESMGYNKSYTFPEVTSTALPVKNYTKVVKKMKRRIFPTTTTASTKS